MDYNNNHFFVSISFSFITCRFLSAFFDDDFCGVLSRLVSSLQITAELLVFDTAALKSDHFILQKTIMNFFCFACLQSP